jgi:hypothetical protein
VSFNFETDAVILSVQLLMAAYGFADIQDEVGRIVHSILQEQLTDRVYGAELIHRWSIELLSEVIKQLDQPQFQEFKFVTSCLLTSKGPNAFYTLTHSLWDKTHDGSVTTAFSNGTIECRVTVYALKY